MTATTTVSAIEDSVLRAANGDDAGNLLIRRLKISGLLSFGPQGIDLPLEPLNVLIGPNGSGKSNLIEALALLRAAPRDLSAPVKRRGGILEWLWKGEDAPGIAIIDTVVSYTNGAMPLRHVLEIGQEGERFDIKDERIENESRKVGGSETRPYSYYRFRGDNPVIKVSGNPRRVRRLRRSTVYPEESILSQRGDPDLYPELAWLQEQYRRIRLYRNWQLGPAARLRRSPAADQPSTFLTERGENLALVLSKLRGDSRQAFVKSLQELYDGVADFQVEVGRGHAELFVVEQGGGTRYIPASRISDGTLRYMTLAAILLDPKPPPLVVIEEPELGLHPDVLLDIGKLLVKASQRTQLVVTTHSRVLVNALDDYPSSVVVCRKTDGQSQFERLDPERLKERLEDYSIGYLWSIGELGGNRW